ncbi:MAG: hypothetical protein OXN97_21430 [Bryobacterales bacterium]|nr:hypothetical protein [Bryobacterales bacterium]MDE0627179.1 hypothetical protein [Bryobacterales bacterium]
MVWFKKIGIVPRRLVLGLVTLAVALMEAAVTFATARGTELMSARLAETWMQGGFSEEFWVLGEVRQELRDEFALAMEWAPTVLFALSIIAILARNERARKYAQASLADVNSQVRAFASGGNEDGWLDSARALLKPIQPLLLAILPVGACPALDNYLPDFMQAGPEIRHVVQYRVKLVPTTNRIHFAKASLERDGTLKSEGSDLTAADKNALQCTLSKLQLELGSERQVTVTLYGFASDEEFANLGCNESNRKNLEVADHRANAVHKELANHSWLTVRELERWLPAESKSTVITERWNALRQKRRALVPQPDRREIECDVRDEGSSGSERDAWRDRVVVLEWTVDEPSEMPAMNEGTVTQIQETS